MNCTYRVFIGVGHGGKDSGACASGYREADVNLVIANSMAQVLIRHNVGIQLSRTGDENDPLHEEVAECNAYAPDLAVEVHMNAGKGKGFEVYRQESSEYAVQSRRLAELIEVQVKAIGQNSRGIKGEMSPLGFLFGWLTGCRCPAVLCEGAFLDSTEDVKMIDTEAKQRAFGVAYARGVLDYLGIPYQPVQGESVGLTAICGDAQASAAQMQALLLSRNPAAPDYAEIYLEEGAVEGIRGDIAFAQSCLETGYWRFGGQVLKEQNNFGGLGAVDGSVTACRFDTPREGIRAQIQHLKAYASTEPLSLDCIDPRFKYVQRGCAEYVEHLGQKENPAGKGWATGAGYGGKIMAILNAILTIKVKETLPDEPAALQKENARLRSDNEAMTATINAIVELLKTYA